MTINLIFDWFFQQYDNTPSHIVVLEIIAVLLGLVSVWFSKQDNILVFPTGMISTLLFVYILWYYDLIGDMLINEYYFVISIYGWLHWSKKDKNKGYLPITKMSSTKEFILSLVMFFSTVVFVVFIYSYFEKWTHWTAYVDTLTTAVFFVGMWLMAKKKIENWLFWIIGDIISIPLYLYKGLVFSSFQYLLFTIIAIYGYKAWKKHLHKPNLSLIK